MVNLQALMGRRAAKPASQTEAERKFHKAASDANAAACEIAMRERLLKRATAQHEALTDRVLALMNRQLSEGEGHDGE